MCAEQAFEDSLDCKRGLDRRRGQRAIFALLVLAVHAAVLTSISGVLFGERGRSTVESEPTWIEAEIIFQSPSWDRIPAPEVQLEHPRVEMGALKLIQFDDPDPDALGKVVGSASAPKLSRFQSVAIERAATLAGIPTGHSETVIVVVEVLPDGLVGGVEIAGSSGNQKADAAAVDYALQLRWIPGTRDHVPQRMRVRLPITLSVPAGRLKSPQQCTLRTRALGIQSCVQQVINQ